VSRQFHSDIPLPSILVQQVGIHDKFPSFKFRMERTLGIWTGELQPRKLSPVYTIRITYRPNARMAPKVKVLSPKIAKNAPHVYRQGNLCLYWPKDLSWSEQLLLADTIIPWTAQWLAFYELWEETGEWLGPESPHRSSNIPKAA